MKIRKLDGQGSGRNEGSVLVIMAIAVAGLAGLSVALVATMNSVSKAQRQDKEDLHARYVCQAGLANAVYNLQQGAPGALGSQAAPVNWGRAEYWVSQTIPAVGLVRLQSTGVDDRSGAAMELTLREVPNTIWRYAAFGDESLHMDSNAHADSYNSTAFPSSYASQAVNGSGTNTYARTNGDVGSNGNVLAEQNSKIWGDATAGPDHTTTVLGNAVVSGSTAPASDPMEFPPITLPTYASFGSLTVNAPTTIPASNRTYTNLVVNSNKTLNITGPANIVVTNLRVRSGGHINIDSTAGPVEIWVIDDFILDSNALVAPLNMQPKDLKINLLSDNVINPEVVLDLDAIDFNSNTQLFGTIYAPNAAIEINSNFQLFGAMIARSIDLDSNSFVHFDEALISATASAIPTYETICWRELPFNPANAGIH